MLLWSRGLRYRLFFFIMAPFLGACSHQAVEDPPPALEDNQKLSVEAIFKDESYEAREPGTIRWLKDGSGYTALETQEDYKDKEPEKDADGEEIKAPQDIVLYDPETLDRTILISASQLTPSDEDRALVVDDYHWSDDRGKLLVYTNSQRVWRTNSRGDYWVLDIDSGDLWQLGGEEAESATLMFAKFSGDATKIAFVREDNIYVQDLASREIQQLTSDASETIINGLFDWAYEEEFGIKDGFRWSPDSKKIAYWQLDTSAAQDFFLINNVDSLYPTITAIPYPKVGEENSAARVGVISLDSGETVWAKLPGIARDMYVPRMDWANNSEEIIVQHLNRKQDMNHVYYANAETGELTSVLVEKEQEFIESVFDVEWIEASDAFIWMSERNGWRHIFKVSRKGDSIVDLTPGEFDVITLSSVDEDTGWFYFIASPDNVTRRYLYRSRIDGSGQMERVTPNKFSGTNSYDISEDAKWAIHTHSAFDQPPQYTMISLPDHKLRHDVENNAELIDKLDNILLGDYEFFQVKAQDGLVLDGFIMRPPNFDPNHQYPIVNYVYGEPAGQTVRDIWYGSRHLWHMLLTQQGFIVASIDNRGTRAPRGREWRKSIYGAVGILGSRDQSDALAAMCERWAYIDCGRVGVWGHSGGGSMTLNLLFRYADQYDVGISVAPVPDQRLYDSIYQERYSGLLEDFEEGYRLASAITFASQLQGKLLLMHGTGDDNVHYQGSERLIDELVRHNRQFDFMSYPNRTHGISNGEGTELHRFTMMTDYLVEHLQPLN
jgi:dipeptidyl-peptidase-4